MSELVGLIIRLIIWFSLAPIILPIDIIFCFLGCGPIFTQMILCSAVSVSPAG